MFVVAMRMAQSVAVVLRCSIPTATPAGRLVRSVTSVDHFWLFSAGPASLRFRPVSRPPPAASVLAVYVCIVVLC
ncbi:unnamed protein product [Caenorhabditis auriculariae]|uniref:Uncharacterized protein n=1 Tax=Caenorhabditis auriculariae TaxID=2777116 RepID=A0A8S1HXP2_9PELO|nr:unnamed protein product [Caenorhabditis auriculariae]